MCGERAELCVLFVKLNSSVLSIIGFDLGVRPSGEKCLRVLVAASNFLTAAVLF